jgi:hypothetical protein
MPPPAVKGPPAATQSPNTPIPGTSASVEKSDRIQRFLNHMFPSSKKSELLRLPADTVGARAVREQLGRDATPLKLAVVTLPPAIGGTMPAPAEAGSNQDVVQVEMKEPWKADP